MLSTSSSCSWHAPPSIAMVSTTRRTPHGTSSGPPPGIPGASIVRAATLGCVARCACVRSVGRDTVPPMFRSCVVALAAMVLPRLARAEPPHEVIARPIVLAPGEIGADLVLEVGWNKYLAGNPTSLSPD